MVRVGLSILFFALGIAYWSFVGGLGWGFGLSAARELAFPDAVGGATGVWLVLFSALWAQRPGPTSEVARILPPGCGGAACGAVTLSILVPGDWSLWIGGLGGYLVGTIACVMKQPIVPVSLPGAGVTSLICAAILAGLGVCVSGLAGWGLGGALSLVALPVFSVVFRSAPVQEIGRSEQVVQEMSTSALLAQTMKSSLSPLALGAGWLWKGALAGVTGVLWSEWASASVKVAEQVTNPFRFCGVLAAAGFVVSVVRKYGPVSESS